MKKNRQFEKMDVFKTILFIIVSLYVLTMIAMFVFAILFSLKDHEDIVNNNNVLGFPTAEYGFKFNYYTDIFTKFYIQISTQSGIKKVYIETMFMNSIFYTFLVTALSILSQVLVAYAVSKYKFKLGIVYYTVGVVVMLIPIVGALPSQLKVMDFMGLRDSYLGIAIMKCNFSSMYFLVFYAMFKGVSWTYAEAAQIDGAGHFQIFIQIMIPMISSTIVSVFILQAIVNWNDYYTPMLFAPNKPTLAFGLYDLQGAVGNHSDIKNLYDQQKIAAALITCLPIVVVFVLLRNRIMGNMTLGGIKG